MKNPQFYYQSACKTWDCTKLDVEAIRDNGEDCEVVEELDNPDFWSVYYRDKKNRVNCIADVETKEQAENLSNLILEMSLNYTGNSSEVAKVAACMSYECMDELEKVEPQTMNRYELIDRWSKEFYFRYKNVDWTDIVEGGDVPKGLPDDRMYWDEFIAWFGHEKIKNITDPIDGEPDVKRKFPNGYNKWMETHHEVVALIHQELSKPEEEWSAQFSLISDMEGRFGFYDLARDWTKEFELKNLGREWEGEFYDEIDAFVEKKIKE